MYDPVAGQFHPILRKRSRFEPEDAEILLFGMDDTKHVVAIEPYGSNEVLLYRRDNRGRTVTERRVTNPWLISSDPTPFSNKADADITELRGEHPYRFLMTFASWEAYRSTSNHPTVVPSTVVGPRSLTAQYQL